jgi:predicted enzyme related to lactoylglutathione lyase
MGHPVVHFEIIGAEPAALRSYYGELFGWTFDTSAPVAAPVSRAGEYGFTDPSAGTGPGIPGGVGGGAGFGPRVLFYVWVADVEAALVQAERLGGTRRMGPERASGRDLVVGYFADPEGNVVGVAGLA